MNIGLPKIKAQSICFGRRQGDGKPGVELEHHNEDLRGCHKSPENAKIKFGRENPEAEWERLRAKPA